MPFDHRTPSIERGCTGEANMGRRYEKSANRLAARHSKSYGVYRCPHCGGTHLTTKLDKSDLHAPLIYLAHPPDNPAP